MLGRDRTVLLTLGATACVIVYIVDEGTDQDYEIAVMGEKK
jgi:hypothetical protein